jgi:hypothetical protein
MREMMILTVILAMGGSILAAHAQTSPRPQSPPPVQSAQPPATTGRALPPAPTGHRQPRGADVPDRGLRSIAPGEMEIDRELKICRDC